MTTTPSAGDEVIDVWEAAMTYAQTYATSSKIIEDRRFDENDQFAVIASEMRQEARDRLRRLIAARIPPPGSIVLSPDHARAVRALLGAADAMVGTTREGAILLAGENECFDWLCDYGDVELALNHPSLAEVRRLVEGVGT